MGGSVEGGAMASRLVFAWVFLGVLLAGGAALTVIPVVDAVGVDAALAAVEATPIGDDEESAADATKLAEVDESAVEAPPLAHGVDMVCRDYTGNVIPCPPKPEPELVTICTESGPVAVPAAEVPADALFPGDEVPGGFLGPDCSVIAFSGTVDGTLTCDGAPLVGAAIDLTRVDGPGSASTTTGADGTYSFAGLAFGQYAVRLGSAECDGGGFVGFVLNFGTISAGEPALSGAVALTSPTPVGGSISGVYECGVPLPGITIQLVQDMGSTVLATTTTDSEGRFSFDDIPFDTYGIQSLPANASCGTGTNFGITLTADDPDQIANIIFV